MTIVLGRKLRRPGTVAAAFAVVVLSLGALGFGLGQHRVDYVISSLTKETVEKRIEMLSLGTREASGNILFGGLGSLILSMVGGGMALFTKNPQKE